MPEDEYYAFVMMNLDLRLASGVDELTARTWSVGASVCEWDGIPRCYYVEVKSDELERAGITPSEAVADKDYPWHVQLGCIHPNQARSIQGDLHAVGYRTTLTLQKCSGSNSQSRYLFTGGTLRAILRNRYAGWGIPPPLDQFHISF